MVKHDLCGAVLSVHTIADGIFYPHNPVRMYLRAAPRAMMVRTLVSPGSFQATLPFGPATLQQHDGLSSAKDIGRNGENGQCEIQTEAIKLVELMEDQLIGIAGLDGKEADNHRGRVQGPKVVMKCPMQIANGTQKTTPALRAWKVT